MERETNLYHQKELFLSKNDHLFQAQLEDVTPCHVTKDIPRCFVGELAYRMSAENLSKKIYKKQVARARYTKRLEIYENGSRYDSLPIVRTFVEKSGAILFVIDRQKLTTHHNKQVDGWIREVMRSEMNRNFVKY